MLPQTCPEQGRNVSAMLAHNRKRASQFIVMAGRLVLQQGHESGVFQV